MQIKFKYDDYYDVLDEYQDFFQEAEPHDTDEQDGNILVVDSKRVVMPQLHISFRTALWYERDEKVVNPNDDAA